MRLHPSPEKVNEFRLKVVVPIGNVEADHPRRTKVAREATTQLREVPLLHHDDEIRPSQVIGVELHVRIGREPRGVGLDPGNLTEHDLGRRTPQSIAAADEEDVARHSVVAPPNRARSFGTTSNRPTTQAAIATTSPITANVTALE